MMPYATRIAQSLIIANKPTLTIFLVEKATTVRDGVVLRVIDVSDIGIYGSVQREAQAINVQ